MNKHFYFNPIILLLFLLFSLSAFAQTTKPQPAAYNQKLQSSSLLFMENKGQVADAKGNLRPDILFTANSAGAKLYLSANAIHYQFTKTEYPADCDPHKRKPAKDFEKEAELQKQIKTSTHRFSLELQSANLHPTVTTEKQSAYTENYYLAHCPNGITGVHGYEKLTYKNVYPNIDWVIYSKGGFMEYDFLVHPGGNPADIQLKVKDAESIDINTAGELVMKTSLGEVREKAPVSYAGGAVVESHFKQLGDGMIGFNVQPQPGKELRIDPSVVWATYYGGSVEDYGVSCNVDSSGNVFMAGVTNSTIGIASGGFQNNYSGVDLYDAFLVKFSRSGVRLWGTYYGDYNYDDASSCVTDSIGNVYLAGTTFSPVGIAFNGFQNIIGGGMSGANDAFLVKFNSAGTRIWATYYGGSGQETNKSCVVDNNGNVYLAGLTGSTSGIAFSGFQNVYGGGNSDGFDAYLVKFNGNGNRVWATYYGGSGDDQGQYCAVDNNNNIYLTGLTTSATGIASGGFQNTYGGGGIYVDAFLVKFGPNGNRIWGTYYGGEDDDYGRSCATDANGNIFLTGQTASVTNISFGGFQNTIGGGVIGDAFLVKFSSNGSRLWATYYGGSGEESGISCVANAVGSVYLAGITSSGAGIASGGFQNNFGGGTSTYGGDGFLVKFNSSGIRLWGSYYGGSGNDAIISCNSTRNDTVYIAGSTASLSSISSYGFQNTYRGGTSDASLAKIDGSKTIVTLCPNGQDSISSNFTGPTYQWQVDSGMGFVNIANNSNYTGTATKTLHFTNLPSSFYDYQYRCFINGVYTEPFQLRFATTWIGTTNSAWENPANWSCGILPDGNTDVIIDTGPVTLNSNGICRTLTVRPGVSFTVSSGFTLTITH